MVVLFTSDGTIKNHYGYNVTTGNLESDMVGTAFYMETLFRMLYYLVKNQSGKVQLLMG